MLLKWISGQVLPSKRHIFAQAQDNWIQLKYVPGFRWQLAGWSESDETVFGVLAGWDSLELYSEFMTNIHDQIAAPQSGLFKTKTYLLANVECLIGQEIELREASTTGYLRVADCRVSARDIENFWTAQREVWNPGMVATRGMQGGVAGTAIDDPARCVIATTWQSQADHELYLRDAFSELKLKANNESHLESVSGSRILLDQRWHLSK